MTQVTIDQQDFSLGMIRDVAAHEIDPRGCYDHVNGLYDRRGSPYKRGGTENWSTEGLGSEGLSWIECRTFDAGQRTIFASEDDFAVLDTDRSVINLGSDGMAVPRPSAMLENLLFIGGGYIYAGSRMTAPYSTGTISVTHDSKAVVGSGTTWNTLTDAGMLMQIGNGPVYPVDAIADTTHLTLRDDYRGSTLAGQSYTLWPIYKITAADPYPIADAYAVCANRLVYLEEDKVRFSEIGRPDTYGIAIGAALIPNEHPLPEGGKQIGLCVVGLTVIMFTTAGAWTLDGLPFDIVDPNGNPQHTVQPLSREMLLWSPPGITYWQQAAIVPMLDAIYIIDGRRAPERVSGPVDDLYRAYVANGYRTGQSTVENGHLFLPIMSASGDTVRDCFVARLDRKQQSEGREIFPWSRFAECGGEISAYAVHVGDVGEEPRLLGVERDEHSHVVDCSHYFKPDEDHGVDADGSPFTWVLITRDYETGSLTKNVVRNIRVRADLRDADNFDPEIQVAVGEGFRTEGGPYYFDIYSFPDELGADDPENDLYFAGEEDDVYYPLGSGVVPENPGIDGYRIRVGPPSYRFVRFRLSSDRPSAYLNLRSIELFIRPSQAVRR